MNLKIRGLQIYGHWKWLSHDNLSARRSPIIWLRLRVPWESAPEMAIKRSDLLLAMNALGEGRKSVPTANIVKRRAKFLLHSRVWVRLWLDATPEIDGIVTILPVKSAI